MPVSGKIRMKSLPSLEKSLVPKCVLAVFLCLGVQSLSGRPAASQQPSTSANGRVENADQSAGPFAIAGHNYTVVLHRKRLASVSDPALAQTLAGVEISDAPGNAIYQNTFPYAVEQGRFQRSLSAFVEQVSGKSGAGLVIHYREQAATSQTGAIQTRESWQLFGMVNDNLAPLGKPAAIGEPGAGGPYMGVMMRAANGSVSVINQPDTMELRAWAGNFYLFIPLRVEWNHGGLAQGQRCMELFGGGMREVGCDMRVEAVRKPPTEEFTFARLFSEANENMGTPEHVVVQKDSRVEILGSRAITMWNENAGLIQPNLSDIWLHVRIGDQAGWIHGEEDFGAIGLPAGSPTP
jgi:hypothetical protein